MGDLGDLKEKEKEGRGADEVIYSLLFEGGSPPQVDLRFCK